MATVHESWIEAVHVVNDESQAAEPIASENSSQTYDETDAHLCCSHVKSNFKRAVCLRSKPAVLILFWSFIASALQWYSFDPYALINLMSFSYANYDLLTVIVGVYAFFAILQLFYPVAGLLADVCYGRRKCVICSLWSYIAGCCVALTFFVFLYSPEYIPFKSQQWSYAILALMIAVIGVPAVLGISVLILSIVAFNANIIPFGLDQLHDSPTDYLVLYIHLYVLLFYVGSILMKLSVSSIISMQHFGAADFWLYLPILGFVLCLFFCLLLISLCISHCKQYSYFLADHGSRNPYKLVCSVICFARKQRYPIQRSAFTYCEDELPSRLDLGKEKYGGPFSVEEVENVKVFLGVLVVLLSLGPLLTVEKSTHILLPVFSVHLKGYSNFTETIFGNDILPSLVSMVILFVYVVILRPLFYDYIPGILKRMLLGMVLLILPTLCLFIIDNIGHTQVSHSSECFLTMKRNHFDFSDTDINGTLGISTLFLTVPGVSYSCGYVIFHIAVIEFICAQSPHSMKGLLIGTFFAIKGVFQLLGALVFMLPFHSWRSSYSFPSCGFVLFLTNIVVALIGLVTFICVARRYQYRQRDEPDNIYRYAEEYYARAEDEPSCDYDDYDNLDVQTIS